MTAAAGPAATLPGLAMCCSQRLQVLLQPRQQEGAQLYQQDPPVPVLMLSNEHLYEEESQEMNTPVQSLGQDTTTPSTQLMVCICFMYYFFPVLDSCLPWERKAHGEAQ